MKNNGKTASDLLGPQKQPEPVSVMDLLRRRFTLKGELAALKEEVKELKSELAGIEDQLDEVGGAAPAKRPAASEPKDADLPFQEGAVAAVVGG